MRWRVHSASGVTRRENSVTMPYPMSEQVREWQRRVRTFSEIRLKHLEIDAEMNEGEIEPTVIDDIFASTRDMGLHFPSLPREAGGAGLSKFEIAVIQEALGRLTNGLWGCYHDLSPFLYHAANSHQMRSYIRPMIAEGRRVAYAITEPEAGSDVDAITATAVRDSQGYVLNGVKMHVTGANLSDWIIFQGKMENDEHGLFYVSCKAPGVTTIRTPPYMHRFRTHHPLIELRDVRVKHEDRIEADGLEQIFDWFRQERMKIAARCCGAASRLIDEMTEFATKRVQFGRPIWDNQAIQFPIADSLTELWAGRLMTYDLAQAMDQNEDVKVLHAKCAMAKLFCSEFAHRTADRAVQVFGGRGYMRENAAERFYRELRVDRIWEGTSEIQRMIILRGLIKRGQEALIGAGEGTTAHRWRKSLRSFIDKERIPLEQYAEEHGGQLPDAIQKIHRQAARKMGLWLPQVPKEYGGGGFTATEMVAVHEEVGRVTNGVGWFFHDVSPFLVRTATPWQMENYVQPLLDDECNECYAITEEGAGSDVDAIEATAERRGNGFVLNGVKWHVTGFNHADIVIFQAKLEDGSHGLFYVDKDHAGVSIVRTPAYSHTYPSHHPVVRFSNVAVTADALIDPQGDGKQWTYEWFRQERLGIAGRCCGAASRLIDESLKFARERVQFGKPIIENQAIGFMLADSLTELWAGRLMIHRLAQAIDADEDIKVQHTLCSMAKLYCSEMANRVADRAVQIFGGRGYMRENPAERFYRELRVDRIWEGTSEIQRLIIASSLAKRGQDAIIG